MPGRPVSNPPSIRETVVMFLASVLNHTQITICQACRYRPPPLHPRNCRHFFCFCVNRMQITLCQAGRYPPLHPRNRRRFFGCCLELYANYNMPGRPVSTAPSTREVVFFFFFCLASYVTYSMRGGAVSIPFSVLETVVTFFACVWHFSASLYFASEASQKESTTQYQQ